ncbi:MAG: hypothetical protein ACBR15_23310 [Microcoleus sp.]
MIAKRESDAGAQVVALGYVATIQLGCDRNSEEMGVSAAPIISIPLFIVLYSLDIS